MVKHIVMWEFVPGKEKEAREFLDKLRGLYGQIEVLRSVEVAENAAPGNDCSAVLIATFDNYADLEAYKTDPRHVAVSSLCKSIRVARHAVDYEF